MLSRVCHTTLARAVLIQRGAWAVMIVGVGVVIVMPASDRIFGWCNQSEPVKICRSIERERTCRSGVVLYALRTFLARAACRVGFHQLSISYSQVG